MTQKVATERVSQCPHCHSKNIVFWTRSRDISTTTIPDEFEFSICRDCGTRFMSLRPTMSSAALFYPEDYDPYDAAAKTRQSNKILTQLNRYARGLSEQLVGARAFRKKIDKLYTELAPGSTFLDYGCGAGTYLNLMKKRHMATIGMDFSPTALRAATQNGHRALQASARCWQQLEDNSIHLVRMNHVLEHLYEPNQVLHELHKKMAPQSQLHLAIPHAEGLTARLFHRFWWSLDSPRHVIFHTKSSLSEALQRAGFVEINVLHEPLVKDLGRTLLNIVSRLGFLNEKTIMARTDLPILGLFLALPMRIATYFGWSDRLHVVAMKAK